MNVLDTLRARGFIENSTDIDALAEHLSTEPRTFYVGFDPTGDSMHVGHLLPVMAMCWLQRAGHRPLAIVGGGTAMVGDPSGKDETREILTPEKIDANRDALAGQLSKFFHVADDQASAQGNDALVINNGDWLLSLNYIEFLREIGSQFSVNRMLTAEGFRQRLDRNQGLSFIEFNYHLLQSYDFLVLNERYGCSLQLGGNDQWFNILGGIDLIRRKAGRTAHALTVPLIMTADGKKMGKTAAGAVWIDPEKVSPYNYYQYWVNIADADVEKCLKLYTFLPLAQIAELTALQGAAIRQAKAKLAFEATAIVHGAKAARDAQEAAKKVFAGQASAEMPTHPCQLPMNVLDAYVASGLTASKGAARRLIQQGGARFDDAKITDVEQILASPGILWAGKKRAVRLTADE
ncbi:MAG: tyrosine--tRNA ligase [Myxococcota bacterium]|nr:tyrosine--tRNA ligase [Myxococcota bacterium]